MNVARRHDEERGGAAGVAGIDDDAAVVVEPVAEVVAVGERRPHLTRLRVLELERGVEEPIVEGQVADVLDLGLDVVAGLGLVPPVDTGRALPAGIGQVAVDGNRASGALDTDRDPGQRRLRRGGRRDCRYVTDDH